MNLDTRSIAEKLLLRENHVFLVLTILLGVVGGLSAVLFSLAIDATRNVLFGAAPSTWRLLAVPTLVSLVTGYLLAKFFNDARGSGVPQTEAAYHLHQGVIPGRVVLGKFLTGASLRRIPGTPWAAKGRRCRSGPGSRRSSADGCGCPRPGCRALFPSARPRPCRPRSTRRWPRCCSPSRRSSET